MPITPPPPSTRPAGPRPAGPDLDRPGTAGQSPADPGTAALSTAGPAAAGPAAAAASLAGPSPAGPVNGRARPANGQPSRASGRSVAPGRPRSATAAVVHRRRRPHRGRPALWLAATAGVVLAWLLVVLIGPRLQVGPGVQELARFGHLAALALGLGAALTVEWFGLLWLLRRRPLRAVTLVANGAHVPIWLGLAGLAVTGMVLTPDQLTTAGSVKLVAVLLVALNGIYAGGMQRRLTAAGPQVPRGLLARAAGTAAVSQLGWWSALVIGYLSAH